MDSAGGRIGCGARLVTTEINSLAIEHDMYSNIPKALEEA